MSWESLDVVGTGQMPNDEEWILFCQNLGKIYLLNVCGNPPDGCEIGTFWQDHDLGSYSSLGFYCENSTDDTDDYFSACETALEKFDSSVDWDSIKPDYDDTEDTEDKVQCEVDVVARDKQQKIINFIKKLTPATRLAFLNIVKEIKQSRVTSE